MISDSSFIMSQDIRVTMSPMECPVCRDFQIITWRCKNHHFICSSCLPRLNHCAVCRADLKTFTNGQQGLPAFCEQYNEGCRELGIHQCNKVLYRLLSSPAKLALKYIIRNVLFRRDFFWWLDREECPDCEIVMLELLDSYQNKSSHLWARLLPDESQRARVFWVIFDGAQHYVGG